MSAEENEAIARRFFEEVVNKRNLAALDELWAPDYVYRNASKTVENHGVEWVRRAFPGWWNAFPDLTFTIEDILAVGDRVVTRFVMRGSHQGDYLWGPHGETVKPTGNRVTVGGIFISRIADGRIVEDCEAFEYAALWQQLGAIPAPG